MCVCVCVCVCVRACVRAFVSVCAGANVCNSLLVPYEFNTQTITS